jgi:hypothetical protein
MLANGALVYPSQGGRYRAVGCIALGWRQQYCNDPPGELGRTPLYVGLPSAWGSVDGDLLFFPVCM